MRSRARRLKVDSGVGMIIVDYLQLIQGPARSEKPPAGDQPDLAIR